MAVGIFVVARLSVVRGCLRGMVVMVVVVVVVAMCEQFRLVVMSVRRE